MDGIRYVMSGTPVDTGLSYQPGEESSMVAGDSLSREQRQMMTKLQKVRDDLDAIFADEPTKTPDIPTPDEVTEALRNPEECTDKGLVVARETFRILAAAVRELAWALAGDSDDEAWRRWDDAMAVATAIESTTTEEA